MEQLGSHWTDFHEIWYSRVFRKIQVSLKSDKNNGYLAWRSFHIYHNISKFFLEWEMFQIEFVEKIKPRILYSITFFSEIVPFMR